VSVVRRLLDKKLRRDLRRYLGSLVAIAVVVACGVATFVAMRSMVYTLGEAQERYYERARFPQVFAHVRRAPESVVRELREIPGIARLHVRAVGEVVARVPGLADPATVRLVGIGDETAESLNLVVLRRGRLPHRDEPDAVTASEGFALANHLALGDTIGAVIGGRWRALRIVGIGISAEFVYELRPGDMLPDPRRYGILWIGETAAAQTFGLTGAWNDIAATLSPGANEQAVIAALDARLHRYGTLGAYGRDLHPSHRFVTEEIRQNRTFAVMLPLIFLAVGAFLVNLVLGRVVAQQRDQIGTMKAFGIPTAHLVRHYVLFALVPTLTGSALGVALGVWLGMALQRIYEDFFRFPSLPTPLYGGVIVVAVVIGAAAAVLGALGALRRILALPPADAMRPEPPALYASGIVERLMGRRGRPVTRMIARGLTHRPWRTALGALGIGLGAAVVVVGSFGFDAVDRMRSILFDSASRADVTVVFAEPRGREVIGELLAQPGVVRAEPGWEAAVRVSYGHRSRQTALVAVDASARLRRVVNIEGEVVPIAPSGVTLSAALGRVLHAGVGDTVDLEFLDGRERRLSLVVASLVEDISGSNAYVDAERMQAVVGLGPMVTSAELAVDAAQMPALYAKLTEAPLVQSVTARESLRQSFDATIQQGFLYTLVTLVLLAAALSAGTIYNAGRVTLSERSRDLASLRVLGFTRGEAARILFGELGLLAALGLPVGLLIGAFFAWATVQSFGSGDLFRLPLVIGVRTVALSVAIPLVAGLLSLWPLKYRLDRLDLIESLKTRE